ncbi:hypothetical protein [Bordetella sp. 15P40C-2]|uniref:hypothetical protein n=1 Tax=Bordetella sp. 15P40C-2 TaxID=2572246 RepID=UPI00132692D3|nr:hypothetical protein [Bordetella sp. 15P40C-2]MVW70657.1 hypothetical protein [Bordetella sp. 15P40C-2]
MHGQITPFPAYFPSEVSRYWPDKPNQEVAIEEAILLQALTDDDLTVFELVSYEALERFAHRNFPDNQNFLHVAIESGRHAVALYVLGRLPEDLINDLLAFPDREGHTPLRRAADMQNQEMVQALLQLMPEAAEAKEALAAALVHAVANGHLDKAQWLTGLGANCLEAFVLVAADRTLSAETRANVVNYLRSRGVDATGALNYAVAQREERIPARRLSLLGAAGSATLATVAEREDKHMTFALVWGDVEIIPALVTLAKKGNAQAVDLIVQQMNLDRQYGFNKIATAALMRVAKLCDARAAGILARVAGSAHVQDAYKQLATRGHVAAIQTLVQAGWPPLPDILREFAGAGNLVAARALVSGGMDASGVLQALCGEGDDDSLRVVDLLLIAGAKPLEKDSDSFEIVMERRRGLIKLGQEILRRPQNEKLTWLLVALAEGEVAQVATMHHEIDFDRILAHLRNTRDKESVDRLIGAGVITPQRYIRLLNSNRMGDAVFLARVSHQCAAQAVIQLAKEGDAPAWEHMRKYLGNLYDVHGAGWSARNELGVAARQALLEVARENERGLVRRILDELPIVGPDAMRDLLTQEHEDAEAAATLHEAGVDINLALMRTYWAIGRLMDTTWAQETGDDLIMMGADLRSALNQAIAVGDTRAQRYLRSMHRSLGVQE